jgi:hypothetical protein
MGDGTCDGFLREDFRPPLPAGVFMAPRGVNGLRVMKDDCGVPLPSEDPRDAN